MFDALFEALREPEAFMALWADDADIALRGSELAERDDGPAQLRAHVDAIAASPTEIRFVWEERRLHEEGDVAWINATGTVNGAPYRLTAVLVRRRGEWRWHTFSGGEPR
ncbi:MAG TPA: nuclear transport factor 2 family protein [Gaiellaceae bacterium]|nr:SnoaL-like domain-containing protein [Thermoleophilia bacterium]HWJ31387.1 nuclear transport factor 2 family protein [Gaiellaceae bacterium]